jgi:hypothetical protein
MSLTQVKSVIENFVQDKRNDLLIIKGSWGVGKTHFWLNTVAEASRKGKIGHSNYSYVSLFGIDSFETLKNSITANQIKSFTIGRDFNLSASVIFSKGKNLLKHTERSNYIRNFSGGLGSELAFQLVKDAVVCFDDLERKSEKFDIKEVLGLASFLKEQRNCKIVFILNEGTLAEKDAAEFQKYKEKVVDIELEFSPTPEETFAYIFDPSDPYFDLIKFLCTTLKIKNIRILQRIKRFIEELLPHLSNSEEVVCKQVISSIILFVWSYYDKDEETISIDFIESFNPVNLYIKETYKNEKPTKEEQETYNLLSKYGYGRTDELDKKLINFVKKGYLEESFFEELKKKNEEVIAQKGKESYSDVWKLHRASLDLDENEFIEKLVFAFRMQEKYLSYSDLFEVVTLLRRYDRNNLANELIDEFLPKKVDYRTLSMMKRLPGYQEYEKDAYFLKKINEIKKPTGEFKFAEVIDKLMQFQYLEEDMLEFLVSADVTEYYKYLKSDEVGEFYFPSKALLEYGNNSTDKHQIILDKTTEALRRIASESRINRNRILDWLGVKVDG